MKFVKCVDLFLGASPDKDDYGVQLAKRMTKLKKEKKRLEEKKRGKS